MKVCYAFGLTLMLCFTGCSKKEVSSPIATPAPAPDPDPGTPGWQWARSLNGPGNEEEIDAVASDAFKNVYISGKFEETLHIQGDSAPFVSAGKADLMVAKYNVAGELLWAKQFGGPGEDNIFDAICDPQGNLILSGYFEGTVKFGDATTLQSRGGLDMVVLKLDSNGTLLWALQAGGSGDDGGNEVVVSDNGQIVVCAQSAGTFEGFPNTGNQDAYILSVTPAGSVSWIRAIQGAGSVRAKAVAVDAQNNVYLGGDFFGSNKVVTLQGSVPLPAFGSWDAYITSWTPSGDLRWSKSWGGLGDDLCKGVVVNSSLEIFMVGQFQQQVYFDTTLLTAASPQNLFLWRLSQASASVWVRHISSTATLYGAELETDRAGGVFFGLGLYGATQFQNGKEFVTVNTPGTGLWPALVNYTSNGIFSGAKFADNSANAQFQELSRSGDRVYLDCVLKDGPHQFGPDQISTAAGNREAAIVSLKIE